MEHLHAHVFGYKVLRRRLDAGRVAAVVNGNYAASYGVNPNTAICYEDVDLTDKSFVCVIAVKSADADDEVYRKVAETFCSDATKQLFDEKYKGFFVPAWDAE